MEESQVRNAVAAQNVKSFVNGVLAKALDIHYSFYSELFSTLRQLDNDQLVIIDKYCDSLTATNCSWQMYELREMIQREISVLQSHRRVVDGA